MSYLIINTNYLFLLKKIICLKLCDLRAKLGKLFIKSRNFSNNIKYNLIIFKYYDFIFEKLEIKKQNGNILYLIIDSDYLFLLKKINCFKSNKLRIKFAIYLIKLKNCDITVLV